MIIKKRIVTLRWFGPQLTILLVYCLACVTSEASRFRNRADDFNVMSAADIIRHRGFKAQEFVLITSDGYRISLIRATNPLINNGESGLENRDVVLFVHGVLSNAKLFLINSKGVKPQDFSSIDPDELVSELSDDPSSNSLVFLLLNMGSEVWLVNRRGTRYSRGHRDFLEYRSSKRKPVVASFLNMTRNSASFEDDYPEDDNCEDEVEEGEENIGFEDQKEPQNRPEKPFKGFIMEVLFDKLANTMVKIIGNLRMRFDHNYWNFNLDTEAKIDVPEMIDFVLEKTNRRKLTYVGHSLGGGLMLMSLAVKPELGRKLNKAILWAPGVNFGATKPKDRSFFKKLSLRFQKVLESYTGPILPDEMNLNIFSEVASACKPTLIFGKLCSDLLSFMFGPGGEQFSMDPAFLTVGPDTTGSHELAQLIQTVGKKGTSFYDYGTKKNMRIYGREESPQYNFSNINFDGLHIYYGKTDAFVQYQDTQNLLEQLTVPYKSHFFDKISTSWNHMAFIFHKRVSSLLNLPCLQVIIEAEATKIEAAND